VGSRIAGALLSTFAAGTALAQTPETPPGSNPSGLPPVEDRCVRKTAPQAEGRRRSPSVPTLRYEEVPCDPNKLPEPAVDTLRDAESIPDRWRLVSMLGYRENLWDPYNGNNVLKGDRPIFGEDWFFALTAISDTVVEPRRFPVPVANTANSTPGSLDTLGDGEQLVLAQTFALEFVLFEGNTVFKPPDYEFRFTPVFNISRADTNENGLVKAAATFGETRTEGVLGVQSLFIDKHLRNVSDRFDFDSIRVGVQPFTSDFRGFLFQDSPLGVRLFGTRANNRYQYNLAWFRRIEKDTNSGLNNLIELGGDSIRDDDVYAANLYIQDFPALGFTSQATVLYNKNREGDQIVYDDNGVIQRPSSLGLERGTDYDVVYVGANGDGHFGRWNVTASAYGAFGDSDRGAFVEREQKIRAFFGAAEVSRDYSWMRFRASLAYASADEDPFENPLFAGADTNFFIREPVPLIGGGKVSLSGRNGLFNSLRSSKEFGQSNFANPGLAMAGLGADFDLTPTLRVSTNFSYLAFADTAVLEVARGQGPIDREMGVDASLALTWRPLQIQNIVARLSVAALVPGKGFEALFGDEIAYAGLGNIVITY
jgi:hypothetical protein